jgi:AcrR family transcriptional regulator
MSSSSSSRRPPPPEPVRRFSTEGRTSQLRGRARRQQIIDETIKLFADKGYRDAGITELARRLGIVHSALLYHFGTKERLMRAVVTERQRAAESEVAEVFGDVTFDNLAEVATFTNRSPGLARLHFVLAAENLDPSDPLHAFFTEDYETCRTLTAEIVRRGQRAGQIRADVDPEQAGREIVATLMGLKMQWLMDPENIDFPSVVDAYVAGLRERLESHLLPTPKASDQSANRSGVH